MKGISLAILIPSLLITTHVLALDDITMEQHLARASGDSPCHLLMTKQECSAFREALTRLPMGEARSQFLAAHFALMREREASCRLTMGSQTALTSRSMRIAQQF